MKKGFRKMNQYNTDSNGALVNTAPLFASVWLALFNQLRKNYSEWRLATAATKANSQSAEQK